MKVKFYLKNPKADNETVVYARVSHKGFQLKIYTGISVLPKHWNGKTHMVRNSPSCREGSSINTKLDNMQSKINKCFYDYQNEHGAEPSPAMFRRLIDDALGRSKVTKLNFFEYFQDFLDRTEAGQRRNAKGQIIKPSKAYKVTQNNLTAFDAQWSKKLDFDTIDLDFYEDYLKFLQKKSLSENTIGREIKNLKAVLNDATERGQNTNLAYKSKRFAKPSEEVDNIALTEKELLDIENLDLSDTPHLDKARDLFLIGCYTGLRYSDYSRLTPDNIKDGFIEIKQQKTGSPVAIPVHTKVKAIIDKYGGNLPESTTNQKTNQALKDIFKQIEDFKKTTGKTRTQGGMKTTVNLEKWNLVSTHTARRTFATNAYLQGIPSITIMAITGHKTEKAFLKYIKVTPKEHAKIMAGIWAKNRMKVAK